MPRQQLSYQLHALDELQVALAMQGDRAAFSLLYRRWHPRLLRHARSLVRHPEDARDIMQEAGMAIAKNIHRLQEPEKFGPWAYTIVRNRCASHIKRLQKDRSLKNAIRTEIAIGIEQSPNDERTDHLRVLIQSLHPADQEVLSAYYVDGMSIDDIATCLAIPSGTVKSRLYTARAHLKHAYAAQQGAHHE